ncbi:MAG: fibronectin type III domain-containing protein [Kaistella sp.]|nr:fibronectin type III domain-containing protein [Kaistella sp.]
MKEFYMKNLISKKRALLFKGVFLWLLIAAGTFNLNAQVSAYAFSQSTGTFSAISGGTVLGVATDNTTTTNLNSNVYPITLPFGFIFNGQNYTSLNVSTNGFITFGALAPTTTNTSPISSTVAYDGAVSAFGHDISSFFDVAGKTGDIRWETVGTAPNREVVIQWTNFRPTSVTATTTVYSLSFQIRLQETTNSVSVVYSAGSYLAGSTTYSSAINQVGLRGLTNADFNNRYNPTTEKYTSSVAGDANGDDQAFNTVNAIPGMPSDGLTYTWTPPSCFVPSGLTTGTLTTGSGVINWDAVLPAPANGYEVYYNTTGTAPTSATVLDGTNSITSGTNSGTITGLTPSTTYYVWVRSKCSPTDYSVWSNQLIFDSACFAQNAPYTENFDSTTVGSPTYNNAPMCWTYRETAGFAGYGYVIASNSNSAPRSYYLNNQTSTTGNQLLVSPPTINLSDGTKWVKFYAKAGAATGYTLEVGTLADPADASTFTIIGSPISITNVHGEYTVMIPAGTSQYVAFRHGLGAASRSIYLDDITVETVPTCIKPSALTVTPGSVTTSTAGLSWTPNPTTPAGAYDIYYSTSNTPPTAATVLDATNSVTVTTASGTITGLTPGTDYFVWVRAKCSTTDNSIWSFETTFVTLCVPVNVPYSQNFDTTSTGSTTNTNAPNCWSYLETSGFTGYGYVSTTNANSAPNGYYLYNSTATTGSNMLISPQTQNLSDGLRRVRFSARSGANNYTLEVGTMSDPTNPASFTVIGSAIALTTSHVEYIVNIPAGSNQYIAFKHGMGGTARSIYLDNVFVETIPTCFEPTAVTVTSGSVTTTSGDLSWTAPGAAPAGGYEVYYSSVNTAPTASTVLNSTNSVAVTGTTATISGLSSATTYYIWVRSVCAASDKSVWTPFPAIMTTLCQPPAVTGTNVSPNPVCVNGTATLTATADSGASLTWYDAASAGNVVGSGTSITTPPLTATTNYWVTARTGSAGNVGKDVPTSTTGNSGFSDVGLMFDALSSFTLLSVDVYPVSTTSTTGTVTIELKNSSGTVLQSTTANVNVSVAGVLNTVPLNFNVPAGTGHRLVVTAATGMTTLLRESTTGFTYPYTLSGICSITSAYTSGPSSIYYYYFYNWSVSAFCESARTMVTAVVDSTCTMGTSEADNAKATVIYPNPFTDVLNISDVKGVKSISVLDISGRVVKFIDRPSAQINLSELQSGMYLISLQYKDGSVHTMKAIKK